MLHPDTEYRLAHLRLEELRREAHQDGHAKQVGRQTASAYRERRRLNGVRELAAGLVLRRRTVAGGSAA